MLNFAKCLFISVCLLGAGIGRSEEVNYFELKPYSYESEEAELAKKPPIDEKIAKIQREIELEQDNWKSKQNARLPYLQQEAENSKRRVEVLKKKTLELKKLHVEDELKNKDATTKKSLLAGKIFDLKDKIKREYEKQRMYAAFHTPYNQKELSKSKERLALLEEELKSLEVKKELIEEGYE